MAPFGYYAPGRELLRNAVAPSRTALLVIDVQNDFAHPAGVMGQAGVDLSHVEPAVAAIRQLVQAAHVAAAPVVFVSLQTTAELDSRAAGLRRERQGLPNTEAQRVCRRGKWGAAWYGVAPGEGDVEVHKYRYSSFQDTGLDLQLRALGVDTLVVCGLTTECCVETAVRDAFHRDYNVFLAEDACASYDVELHVGAVRTMAIFHALIVRAAAVADVWAPGAPRIPSAAELQVRP